MQSLPPPLPRRKECVADVLAVNPLSSFHGNQAGGVHYVTCYVISALLTQLTSNLFIFIVTFSHNGITPITFGYQFNYKRQII
ncbi:hypothetical protein CROQUDRAFT_163514 [Cronartium quercuum f. sp. fusiforme G11]|uniref:Uncharacterized protein n=1 Tax=Cronartium quercuum f. sp. fusiforme G11 TaxID=708437 RepID=A0A9P6NHP9_9BASI|nr:hypothetical protein CROQUDRAFT_163514 [Cronartium quercuum f. sp. fusiforme G11]